MRRRLAGNVVDWPLEKVAVSSMSLWQVGDPRYSYVLDLGQKFCINENVYLKYR